jgi:CubicO group peptidase (beta-lactamase class C family)
VEPQRLASVERIVQQAIEEGDFAGVVILHQGGDTLFARACGLADRANGIPNELTTRFGIASGAKSFTAVAICQLVESGRLDFATRLLDLLDDDLPAHSREITIEQVLTHTSGMPDYADENLPDADFETLWRDLPVYRLRRPRDLLPLLRQGEPKFGPGTRFEYCNSGYVLLGLVIEAVTGLDYYAHMEQQVFARAGLGDTGFFETDRLPARTALGHIPLKDRPGHRTNIFSVPARGMPDGGLYSTAGDLLRFYDALRQGRLAGAAMTRALLTPHVDVDAERGQRYGYGFWFIRTTQGVERMTIVGGDPGVQCSCRFYPERDLQLVMLTNLDEGLGDLGLQLEAAILG